MRTARPHLFRRLLSIGTIAVAAVALTAVSGLPAAAEGQVIGADRAGAIDGSYVVVLKDSASPKAKSAQTAGELTDDYGGDVKRAFKHALNGFAASMSAAQARRMAADSRVAYVEQDATVHAMPDQPNPPSWGLDRIDQRNLPLNQNYHYDTTASNVDAYIIDTGLRLSHSTFGGRAINGVDTIDGGTADDCNGHGTHVGGTVGGSQYGVAKGVRLYAVRVLNCSGSGSVSQVVRGIDWVTGHHQAGQPAVANMSLGGGGDTVLDTAVRNSIADGVSYAIASGNSNANACNSSPARVTEAMTVNASTITDARATFSNYGTCTDLFAPGANITSAWYTSDTATNTISGTSMATPHVAGAAALWLATHPGDSPAAVQTALKNNATLNKITNPGSGSPNRLVYTGTGAAAPSVVNPGNRTGTVGTATSLQLSASGGTPPYTWSATGLPPGLSVNATSGLISGTPTTQGTYSVAAKATDAANQSGTASFTWTINATGGCASPGQKLGNPGFESGSAPWTATTGVIGAWSGIGAPRSGSRSAWLDGYGSTHTDTLSQTVSIPAGCSSYTLSFWLKINSSETTTSIAYDRLTVQLGSTTLAAYSNLNETAGYVQRTFNVSAFAGQNVTLKFTGTEDFSLQTSFVLDDLSLTAG